MSIGLIGRKCGMTRIFTETGSSIPVTLVEVIPNRITQVKTVETDGYRALQVAYGKKPSARVNKPLAGHYFKAAVEAGNALREFRLGSEELTEAKAGDELKVDIFKEGQLVDVRGLTRGKGFAGTVKRHNFRTQDATHGNSLSHRAPGSIGQCQTLGRVWKDKKMAGQLGNVYCTVQNQEIIKVDVERNLLSIKGALPGAPGGEVIITQSSKKRKEDK
ncbi:50S ribosomal protein L3 [Coxiella endosymbiont of Ornithodoros amblus]|uniref:50S ribosomal protein L3 n=1 Tax=Coxiella endosymbiont of Ornithodoros amblus TaxID=1656166 RepID=UPI00244E4A49|nr:50S ribosomal protein L3 [Coxiella endosymbiont of Ornithodoros amblus]MBW5802551.1 50S ribosomal protein L3 [Coxiella endosymbiont of Ornithodoros amblus]